MKKKFLAVLLIVVVTVLCGCGMSGEDAKSYAQSVLDASYKGEFKEYIDWTKSSEKEAEEMYESNIDAIMKAAGVADLGLSEELTDNYRFLFKDMLKKAKYELGDAKEADGDAYTIDVTVEPFLAFEGLENEVTTQVQEILAGASEIPSEEEINELLFQKMYEIMSEKVANPTYGEATTVTIHIQPDSDGIYYIPQEDRKILDDTLFPGDSTTEE